MFIDKKQKILYNPIKFKLNFMEAKKDITSNELALMVIEMHLMNVVHRTKFEKLKDQVKILQKKAGVI